SLTSLYFLSLVSSRLPSAPCGGRRQPFFLFWKFLLILAAFRRQPLSVSVVVGGCPVTPPSLLRRLLASHLDLWQLTPSFRV
ncbi:hypothetical protein LINPERHAP1_LOCUS1673, partial [Linum perenne]